jgi:dTDP-4-dehydrorhamnose 3,5-epimerase
MKIEEVGISGLLLVVSDIYRDSRGFLYERYNEETSKKLKTSFVQQNISVSQKSVLRGMHWQYSPHAQGKLVTCLSGAIYDVAVDLRVKSSTFGSYFAIRLDGKQGTSLWIPSGFAHGFQSLEEESVVTYSVDHGFAPNFAKEFNPFDPKVGISWPLSDAILSTKDMESSNLEELDQMVLFKNI